MTYKHLILCILIVSFLYEISGMSNTALPTTILNEDNELPTTSSGNDVIDISETGSGSSNTVYSTHTTYIDGDITENYFRTQQTSTNLGASLLTSTSLMTNSPTSTLDTSTSDDLQQTDLIDTSPTSPPKIYSTTDGEVTTSRILTSENAFISNISLAFSSTPSSSFGSTSSTPVDSFNKKDLKPAIKIMSGSFINDSCFCLKWKLVNNVDYFHVNISGVAKNVTSHEGDTYNTTVCGKGERRGKKMKVRIVGVSGGKDLFQEKDAILTDPPSPKNLKYIPENNKLTWQKGIGKTDKYEIQIKSTNFNINNTIDSTTYVLNSTLALPGDQFNVSVIAVRFYKGHNQTMKSEPLSFEFTTRPDPPQNISLRVSNTTCIQVSWSSGFGYRDGYSLSLNSYPAYNMPVDRTNNQETFNKTFCQLKPCEDYQIQIQTISNTITSKSEWSNTIRTASLECSLTIKNITESSLIVECSNLLNIENVTYTSSIGTVDYSSNTSVQQITGLQPATDYTLILQILFNSCTTRNTTSFTTLDGTSSGVKNLSLVSNDTNLLVTWTPPDTPNGNITSYIITLVDIDRNDTIVKTTVNDMTNYRVVYGSQYKVTVVAVNGAGLGEATEKEITVPEGISSSITNLKLTLNDTKLWVTWNAPERPNGNITSYDIILVNLDSNTTITNVTTNHLIEFEVSYGSQYKVTVVAVNGAGLGEATEEEITVPEGISSSITNLKLTPNDTKLRVTWNAPERPNGNITSYNIILVNLDSNTTITNVTTNHLIEFEVSYVNCYNVSVIPVNGAGPGELTYETITIPSGEPSPVRELRALDVTSTSLNISWRRPNNGIINKYDIFVSHDQKLEFLRHLKCDDCQSRCNTDGNLTDSRNLKLNFNRNQETFNILFPGLRPYSNYTVEVKANTLSGYGKTKQAIFETSEDVPSSVKDVQVIDVTSTSFTVKWSKPDEYRGNTRYTVIVTDSVSREPITKDCGYKVTECRVDGLDAYRSYNFIVNASNQAGYNKTKSFNATTTEDSPSSIKDVTVANVTSTSVTLKWSKPEQYQGNTSYSITVQVDYRTISVKECGYQVTSCMVQGLQPYQIYELTVNGNNTAGSTKGNKQTIQTKEAKPGPVESFKVLAENDRFKPRTIVLNWNPPTQSNGVILKYEIQYKYNMKQQSSVGVGMHHLEVSNDSHTRMILVSPEKQYVVQIAAVNGAGSGQITERKIEVPAGVLPKPKERTPMTRQSTKHPVSDSKQQIAIELPMMFLCNNTYGQIKHTGILATKTIGIPRVPMEGDDIRVHPSWSQTSVSILTYRVTGESWKPDCQSGLTKTDFVVGNDRNCENNHHLHCNGYLKPNTKYRFKVFVCTEAGCTYLDYSLPISTDAEESSNLLTIFIGVALALIIIGIAGFVLYRTRNRHICRFLTKPEPEHATTDTVELSVEANRNRPIKLCNFEHHIARLHQDSNIGFSEEYKAIKRLSPKYSTKAAERESCRIKNRYTNVLPFDHTRVKLLPVDDDDGSEYINANYLAGYNSKREYIAAQGPLPATLDDFWRMIWEHHISVAVMLTQCKEKNTTKCERYWPETNEPIYFGDLIVRMRSESVLPDYVIRIIDVQLGIKKRTVKQFHFLKWPDFGCPEKTWLLLNFVTAVRAHIPNTPNGPMLVHCSAGVGRTGTFVAVDVLLQKIRDSDEVDIFDLVLEMRENRPLMVQTENQYVYIHDCIRDALMDDTEDEESLNENIYENDVIYQNT